MDMLEAEKAGFSPARLRRLEEAMQRPVDSGKITGVQTLLYRRGRMAHTFSCGWLDPLRRRPMPVDALFRIYSMTKPVTSTAVMILWEEGRLRPTDPVSAYLPEFNQLSVFTIPTEGGYDRAPLARPVTIHDLLTHTSGLAYGLSEDSPVDILYRNHHLLKVDEPLSEKVKRLAALPLLHQPGERFTYSMGTDVLGYLVEVVSGKPFDIFLKDRLFGPLGMVDTDFYVPAEKKERLAEITLVGLDGTLLDMNESPAADIRAALDHYKAPPEIPASWAHPHTRPGFLSGGGGLFSSLADYLRFARMLLSGGALDGERILGRKTVGFMTLHQIPNVTEGISPGTGIGYGLSMVLDPARAMTLASRGAYGWGGLAGTEFWIDPREDMLGLLMLQMVPGSTTPIQQDFKTLAMQAIED